MEIWTKVNRLIANGADVNAENSHEQTPLHLASRQGHDPVAEALLMAGADVNDKDNDGWTPLHLAINSSVYIGYDNTVEVEFLLTAGADVNAVNNSGQLPLDIVIQNHLDGHNIRGTLTILTPKTASPAAQGELMAGTSALTIEQVGEERTEVRWKDGVLQFSPEADGQWRDV